jgi:anti-sigma B factor antagonist
VSGISVIKVAGEIDTYTAPGFRSAIQQAIDARSGNLVIDLSDVAYMDSSGFGSLLGAARHIKSTGGAVKLTGCSEAIERIIHITGLDASIEVFSTLDEAIGVH